MAGFRKVEALICTTRMVEHHEGGDPSMSRKWLGPARFEAIPLERGAIHDQEFVNWASKGSSFRSGLGAEAPAVLRQGTL